MEEEIITIQNEQITRGLEKFAKDIFKCFYIINGSHNMIFMYDLSKDEYESKFDMSNLHFYVEIYKGEITIYYKPTKKLCSITKDEKGELHFEGNKEINSTLYDSLLFKFLYSCSYYICNKIFIDNDGIRRWVINVMK